MDFLVSVSFEDMGRRKLYFYPVFAGEPNVAEPIDVMITA